MNVPHQQSVLEINQAKNRSTRDSAQSFSTHRSAITELISKCSGGTTSKLCIFGAGNSNDVEVDRLVRQFQSIQLVDIDSESLALSRQKYQLAAAEYKRTLNLDCLVCDLTGLFDPISLNPRPMLETLCRHSQQLQLPLPTAYFDCVASTCVLSQIVGSLLVVLGQDYPDFVPLTVEVRRRHLQLMIQHLRPGGRGVFVTDFVSSVTWPKLGELTSAELNQSVVQQIQTGNFFTGCNPSAIISNLREDPWFAANIAEIELSPCWCWDLGTQQMAVIALTLVKS